MLIASKRKLNLIPEGLQILINDTLIEQVKRKEVLGIIIDEELKWKEHINAQCKKLSSAVALLRRAKPSHVQLFSSPLLYILFDRLE